MARLRRTLALLSVFALLVATPHLRMDRDAARERAEREFPSDLFLRMRAMPDGTIPSERIAAAVEQLRFERALGERTFAAQGAQDWVPVGPYNIGGRVNALVAAPGGFPAYLGSANGGVFRSDDMGANWQPLTDANGIFSIGAIALHPTHPYTVWVGTGDANGTVDGYDGTGVYVSRDGGAHWTARGLRNTSHLSSIVVSPADSNVVLVGAMGKAFTTDPNRGLYRSTDGGATWTRTLFVNDSTGVSDIAINPLHPDTVYCATWTRVRRLTYRRAFGPDCAVWRSTNGGVSWTRIMNGLPPAGTDQGRFAIAVAPSRPSTLYASCTSGSTSGYVGTGLYRSDDGGDSWTRVDLGVTHRNAFGGFAWYFGRVVVSPIDPDDVWVLGVRLLHSVDGGATLADVTGTMHVDQHALWLDPLDLTRVWVGNDGGFFWTNAGSWQKSLNLPITQFYSGAVAPGNSARIIGGAQDNGTVKTETGPSAWSEILGGDGLMCQWHPSNANLLYAEWQYSCDRSGVRRSTNSGTSFAASTGWVGTDRFNWNTPYTFNPRNANTMLAGTHRAYKSLNGGVSWSPTSSDLTTNPGAAVVFGTISAVTIANTDTSLYLVGTDDGRVWRSLNAGATWQDMSSGLPKRYVTCVVADPNQQGLLYVSFSGFGQDLHDPRVFRSTDTGLTWTAIDGNLPDAPVNDLIPDPLLSGTLYAATDLGVFVSRNQGGTWTPLGGVMPIQPVWDLVLHAGSRQLFAFTHGRSAWKLDLGSVPLDVPTAQAHRGLHLAAPTPNPARTTTSVALTLASNAQVHVAVYDASGRRVRDLHDGPLASGRHPWVWDACDARGARVRSGVYFVRASDGVTSRTQRLVVVD